MNTGGPRYLTNQENNDGKVLKLALFRPKIPVLVFAVRDLSGALPPQIARETCKIKSKLV